MFAFFATQRPKISAFFRAFPKKCKSNASQNICLPSASLCRNSVYTRECIKKPPEKSVDFVNKVTRGELDFKRNNFAIYLVVKGCCADSHFLAYALVVLPELYDSTFELYQLNVFFIASFVSYCNAATPRANCFFNHF